MGLFNWFKKKEENTYNDRKPAQKTVQKNHQPEKKTQKPNTSSRSNTDMNKLAPDGELPWGWVYHNADFTAKAQAEYMKFYKSYSDNKYGDPKKKYAALKSLLLYIEDAKKKYAQKGECFLFWFVSTWAKDEEVKELSAELKYTEEHIEELEEAYKKRQYIENILIPDIKKKAIEIIKNNPGIIQTDVYNFFEPEVKMYVQDVLRVLSKTGKIKREKYGRTYKLTI